VLLKRESVEAKRKISARAGGMIGQTWKHIQRAKKWERSSGAMKKKKGEGEGEGNARFVFDDVGSLTETLRETFTRLVPGNL